MSDTLQVNLNEKACQVEVREMQPGEEAAWDRFVMRCESGTFFHLTGWRKVVERVMGHRSFCLTAWNSNSLTGVFPISRVQSRLFGDCLVSMPLAVYGGICAQDETSHFALLKAGNRLAHRLGVQYLEMRNRTETYATDLPGRSLYVTFTQNLSPGPDKLLSGLPRDTRYMIRKSQKAGLDWTQDLTPEEFYDLYARSAHRLGTPVFSRQLFATLLSEFPTQAKVFGVRKNGKAIAGVLCFYYNSHVLPYYGASLAEFNRDAPNNFMYWNLIAQSCREGHRHFDFGRSKRGTGSFDFKSTWGMQIIDLPYRYDLICAKKVPQLSAIDSKFQLPVRAWKRLPFALTKVLGPTIVRWIPSV
jgi:FemAB-related protein (PEP-CTERM system-associated)